jgi:Secretion system C-terminal sorting domain
MKMKFTHSFIVFILCLVSSQSLLAAAGDYRSAGTGNWSNIASWETDNGVSWVPAVAAPTSADGAINIRTGHTITLDGPVTADQLTVDAGGNLNINVFASPTGGNNLTLAGAGTQLTVNGTLLLRGFNVILGTGSMVVNGTFNWFSGRLSVPATTAVGSTTNLDLEFTKNLNANFTNNGTLNWINSTTSPFGDLLLTNSILTNNGTINEQFVVNGNFSNGGGSSFINNGTFNKTTTFVFANNSIPITNSATGIIQGLGALSINFGTMTNNGIVRPGTTIGILNMNAGTVSSQNTTINIGLLNLSGPGTGNDVLNLTTTAAFNINLSTVSLSITELGFVPLGSYTILTTDATGTFINTFANIGSLPANFSVVVNAGSVVLTKNSSTLPAVWGGFEAVAKNNKVHLNWSTLQEDNTSHFLVEHSTNGRDFKSLASIPAASNSASSIRYNFTHSTPNITGVNFYRIKLYDLDGKSSGSWILPVRFSGGAAVALQAAPNPFLNNLQLTVNEEAVLVKITDINGRLLKSLNLQPGVHNVDVSSFSSGMYTVLAFRQNKMVLSQKIIKQ